jgi:HlyD family secretion protein
MTDFALSNPSSKPARRWVLLAIPVAGLLIVLLAWQLLAGRLGGGAGGSPVTGQYYRVVPMTLEVRLAKDGELQAINAIDITSDVEGQTTIQEIVKEGATVKRGDVLVVLDSSAIRQKIEDTTIDLQKAEAEVTNARELRGIQESKNAADLEAAEVALTLAQLDLRDYEEAAYPQQLANAQTDLQMAEIDLKNRREDLAQTRNLLAKGFVNAADVKKAELEVTKAENAVSRAQTALRRLMEYTHASNLAAKKNALSQAEQRLARVTRENASQMSQRNADVAAKEQNLYVITRRMERLQQQLAGCTIVAPADGMVVYATSGDRNAQNMIQEGTSVRERQTILRLPDTSSMKVVLRVPEAQVPRLREGQRAKVRVVGVPEPIGATLQRISVLADSGQRWWNPDVKEFPVELVLDQTPRNLKPGMGVMAEVLISSVPDVLAVPLASVYSVGNKTYVFRRGGPNGVTPVQVKLGATNDTHAAVGEGLSSGDEVLVLERGQGQELLERNGIHIEPSTQPTGGFGNAPPGAGGRQGRPGGMTGQPREGGGRDNATPPNLSPGAAPTGDQPIEGQTPDRPRRNRGERPAGGNPGANAGERGGAARPPGN